jgi:hypothetical protein
MKSCFSSANSKFSAWMSVCVLGLTLVGLPATAFAQDALVVPSTQSILHASRSKIYVKHTTWLVEYAQNGHNGNYHPVPWIFSPDGTVRSGHLWQGTWERETNDTIRVAIQMNDYSGTAEEFLVKFTSPSKFTAYKYGQPYRYGVRQ